MDFSLIVPCYNEEGNIREFFSETTEALDGADVAYELIFVDDGSTDGTLLALKALVEEYRTADRCRRGSVAVISFSRNFGKEAAMLAGLERARGDFVGLIDADLQQDPVVSLQMLRYLQDHPECDSVAAVPTERKEGLVLHFFKRAFYRVFNAVGDTEIAANASDFRVFKQQIAGVLTSMPEYFRFSKGLFAWVGFHSHTIEYEPRERLTGTSTWSFRRLFGYALGGIMSFSTWPLKLAMYLGLLTSAVAVLNLISVLFEYTFLGIDVPGYPTLVCLVLLFNGVLMLVLGIFGEYLGRIYLESKHRPLYIAREAFSTEEDKKAVCCERTCINHPDAPGHPDTPSHSGTSGHPDAPNHFGTPGYSRHSDSASHPDAPSYTERNEGPLSEGGKVAAVQEGAR